MGKVIVNPSSGDIFVAQANLAKVRNQNKETLIRFPGEPGTFWKVFVNPRTKEVRYIPVDVTLVDEVSGD